MERLSTLLKAVRFNHDKEGDLRAIVSLDKEIEKYESRITQLTLPARFGMYKPQVKDVPVKDVDSYTLDDDDDGEQADSRSSYMDKHPDHRRRKMF